MKCPFKKQIVNKDCEDQICYVSTECRPPKVCIDFGECDERGCAAWNYYKGKCMLVYKNEQ